MMIKKVPHLVEALSSLNEAKIHILKEWMLFDAPREILQRHGIEPNYFVSHYGSGVFDYFMDVIKGRKEIGDCPVMGTLLEYLKDRDISADELFIICSHFRKSMLDYSYDSALNSKVIFDEISYLFDLNFSGVLKRYTDTIYEKEQEIKRNVKLLNEYKKAIDASAIVSKIDLQGRITFINDNFCEVSGYKREELLDKAHNEILSVDQEQPFNQKFLARIENKSVFKSLKKQRKDGSFFYVDSTIIPIVDTIDRVTEYIVIGYEVTKLMEAKQEAVEAGLSKEYFLSNMSHEIRTPLNAILGFVSILQDEIENDKHKKYLDIVLNSSESLLNIINDILDFSKLQSGEFTIENRMFNLHEELSHTLELFVASASEKDITMISFIDPSIAYELDGDILRIKQIVSNFISNAIKFTPSFGVIELEASYQEGDLLINIKDSGIGIDKEDQGRIFDAFLQAKQGDRNIQSGTGLGLAICKQLAQHMGGDVSVQSQLGVGSIFTLQIPVNANTTSTIEMFNVTPFKKLRIGLLQEDGLLNKRFQSLQRYLDIFDLNTALLTTLEGEYDLLFFCDETVHAQTREEITKQNRPAIAVMEYFDSRYDTVANITPLYFPIYCSKLYHTFLEALEINNDYTPTSYAVRKSRRFEGKILVAEDNLANQELMRIILEGYGLHFMIAADGKEALRDYKSSDFDLILMDEQMPKMSGTEVTRAIRKIEKSRGIDAVPIIALTANVLKGEKERSKLNGFSGFLGKPIDLKTFEEVLSQFLVETEPQIKEHKSATVKERIDFDIEFLAEELMLEKEQVLYLLDVYKKRMHESLKELHQAIEDKDYKVITHIAHSIKGSSANFRIDKIVEMAYSIEKASYEEDNSFDYEEHFKSLEQLYKNYAAKF